MRPFIDLNRRFHLLTSSELDEPERLLVLQDYGGIGSIGWSGLLKHRRVVVLAEAGSGKSREMAEQAGRMAADGRLAIFVPLEGLSGSPLPDLLSPDEEHRLQTWKVEGTEPGYFFLDSVDELKLNAGTLDQALLRLARALHGHLARAHVVISCRPADWRRGTDQNVVERRLSASVKAPLPTTTPSEERFLAALRRDAGDAAATPSAPESSAAFDVQTMVLLPLSDRQIRLFAEQSGVENAEAFLEEIERRNAWTFARRPLDLTDLAETWIASGDLGCRLNQHEANVAAKLRDDPDRPDRGVLGDAEARQGAQRLALALALTRTRTLRSPDQAIAPERIEGALDPAGVLPDWTEEKRQTLLRRALFDPATYGRVRFHHRSVQEYLAACHLRSLRERGMSIKALLRLLFATRYGVEVVYPSMRPIAAWLALWVPEVRAGLMEREPEALLLFGDPESLSIGVRAELLMRFVEAYGEGGWRGLDVPLEEVRRLAHPDQAPVIRRLWGDRPANVEVRELLIEMIWQGRIAACVDLARAAALDVTWSAHGRIVAVRALKACGETDALREVAANLMAQPDRWPDRVVFSVAEDLFPDVLSLEDLLALMRRTREPREAVDGFGWAARRIAEKIDPASAIAGGVRDAIAGLIFDARADAQTFYAIKGSHDYLAPALAILCRRKVDAVPIRPEPTLVRAAVVASRFGESEAGWREPIGELRSRFQTAPYLRGPAFWTELAFMDELVPAENAQSKLYHASSQSLIGRIDDLDRPWLNAALSDPNHPERHEVALHALVDLWHRRGRREVEIEELRAGLQGRAELLAMLDEQTRPRPVDEEHVRWEHENARQKERAAAREERRLQGWLQWRDELLADPDEALSRAKRDDAIGNLHLWLQANGRRQTRFNVWNKGEVDAAFGENVARLFQAAFREHWRKTTPVPWSRRPLDERHLTPHVWIQGLYGVSAESEEPGWAFGLSREEARLAAAYSMIELNGLTGFLSDLVAAHPAEVESVLGDELAAELAAGAQHSHVPVLQNLAHAGSNLKRLLAPRLIMSALTWPLATTEEESRALAQHLDLVLDVLAETTVDLDRERVAAECEARLQVGTVDPLGRAWLKGLFRLDAERGAEAFAACLGPAVEPEARSQAVTTFASLFGRHRGSVTIEGLSPARHAQVLGQLVRMAYAYVRRDEDISHEGSYSPDLRDDAQDARNALLSQLLDTSGDEARHVVLELANEPDFVHLADRLRYLARRRAATDAEFSPYVAAELVALERRHEAPPHDRDGLFAVMLDRLDDLQHDLSHGDFTDRQTLRRVVEEPEMQPILAGRLRAMANDAYSVTREPEVADNKLPDIQFSAMRGEQRVVAELKLADKDWSVADLEHTLEHQIVGQYLRHETCKGGCLLLTYGHEKRWNRPGGGTRMTFRDLVEHLNEKARQLEETKGDIRLKVVGIDLRDPPLVPAHR